MDKLKVFQQCLAVVESNISAIKLALKEAQDAANNETKSTAGDKHETGRAMAQLETEKLSAQLNEALKMGQAINQLNPKQQTEQVLLGSLVTTNKGNFYVAISLGKIEVEGKACYIISPVSPIGKILLTKKEKDSFSLNGTHYVIEKIL
ncbi:MAG: 3-oxoacyl-ACP synthase [Flavobacteriales bacterium]